MDQHIKDLISNPEYSAADTAVFIEALKKRKDLKGRDLIVLGKLLMDRHKGFHGEKHKVEHSGSLEGVVVNIVQPKKNGGKKKWKLNGFTASSEH